MDLIFSINLPRWGKMLIVEISPVITMPLHSKQNLGQCLQVSRVNKKHARNMSGAHCDCYSQGSSTHYVLRSFPNQNFMWAFLGGESKNTELKNNPVFEVLTIQNTDVET